MLEHITVGQFLGLTGFLPFIVKLMGLIGLSLGFLIVSELEFYLVVELALVVFVAKIDF